MKKYFIDATKEIIKGESISALTVRNVADRAGYSYATLYNYFKDLRKLIFEALKDFLIECKDFISIEIKTASAGEERIRKCAAAYIKFFVQYPSIYQLVFIDKANSIGAKSAEMDLICNIPNSFLENDWIKWQEQSGLPKDIIPVTKENFNLIVNGLLLFYMNRGYPESYFSLISILNKQLDLILRKE